jgi:hypothetical protein
MVWIVDCSGLYGSNRYILAMILCMCEFDTHINHMLKMLTQL